MNTVGQAEDPQESRAIGRGGLLNLVGAVCQQASMLLITVLVARVLGQRDLGRYTLAYAALTLVSLFALFGFRAAVTRYVAVHLARGEDWRVHGLVRFTMAATFGAALLLGTAMVLSAPWAAREFSDPALAEGLRFAGATVPAFGLRDLGLAAVQGWRTQRAFALIGWICEPLARLALTAVALAAGLGLTGAYLALLLAAWAAAGAACVALWRRLRVAPRRAGRAVDVREVLRFSTVSWGTTLASTGLIWADSLLLGWLDDSASVGVYTVATRLVSLAVFVMAPVNALFAPQFAHLHALGDRSELRASYAAATNWIMRLSLPAFVVLAVFPGDMLHVFGRGFPEAAVVTVVLAVGQLVNAVTGPCGTLLNMSGHVTLNLVNNVAVLALNVGLNLLLIPSHGFLGAGIAWSISLTAVNLARLAETQWLLHLHPFTSITWRATAAALAAVVAAVIVKAAVPGTLAQLATGVVVVVVVYLAVSLVLGFSRSELETVRGALGRRSSPPSGGAG